MLFDSTLLFFHTGNVYNMTAGEYVSLVGATATSSSTAVNLGNARDLGIGAGPDLPSIMVVTGAALTSSCSSMLINAQFQGSTDSVNWTTYIETGALSTASYGANVGILPQYVPRRPAGAALPLYYRMNFVISGGAGTAGLSTGTVIGGIILDRQDSASTLDQYAAGFSVS